ncbi:MAG: hypothetical protein IKD89_00415 [Clostridia bacterium]|nr:hypothetical protein [Clostridia bacterium]
MKTILKSAALGAFAAAIIAAGLVPASAQGAPAPCGARASCGICESGAPDAPDGESGLYVLVSGRNYIYVNRELFRLISVPQPVTCEDAEEVGAPAPETPAKPDITLEPSPDGDVADTDAPPEDAAEASGEIGAAEREVVRLTNEIRASYGLPALSINEKLSAAARAKALDMAENGYFSHESPSYGSPFDMMRAFGVTYRSAGENIAYGYRAPEAVVTGWMNSASHRENILNPSFTEIGVGFAERGAFWSQMFIG